MQEGTGKMKRYLIIILLGLLALSSCKTKYVSVPEYHTRYVQKTDTLQKIDSVFVKDSVFVFKKGDTVIISKLLYRDRYKYLYRTQLDSTIKRDSIPYPVVRELTKNEQRLISIGRYSFVAIVTLCVVLIIFWYRNKKC